MGKLTIPAMVAALMNRGPHMGSQTNRSRGQDGRRPEMSLLPAKKSLSWSIAALTALIVTLAGASLVHAVPEPKVLASFRVDRSGAAPVNTYAWTVPKGVSTVTFDVFGGSGGGRPGSVASGGEAKGTFSVVPGTVFQIVLGGEGGPSRGGLNGGGLSQNGFGGGGGSDVRAGSCAMSLSCTYADRFVVAGGGGGRGGTPSCFFCPRDRMLIGGGGGGLAAHDATDDGCTGNAGYQGAGGGGTPVSGGAGGGCEGVVGTDAAGGTGSFGGGGRGGLDDSGHAGGGGGGGWFGGGGGSAADRCSSNPPGSAEDPGPGCGGGGGSGHIVGLTLSSAFGFSPEPGDGYVVIYKG